MNGVLIFVVMALVVVSVIWHYGRSSSMLEEWARASGYTLIDSQRRLLRRGPFWWRTSKGQEVFYVVVQGEDGEQRSGYVRCGGWFAGMFSSQVSVEWDDE